MPDVGRGAVMGTDIHLYVERNSWTPRRAEWPANWTIIEDSTRGYSNQVGGIQIVGERNYDRFAVLGLSRRRDDVVKPWPLRGLPKDISESARWLDDSNVHGCSWLGLDELLDFEWDLPSGVIRDETDEEFRDRIKAALEKFKPGEDVTMPMTAMARNPVSWPYRRLVGNDFIKWLHGLRSHLSEDYNALDMVTEDALHHVENGGEPHPEIASLILQRRAERARIRLVFGFDS